jgi:hypothetical protein
MNRTVPTLVAALPLVAACALLAPAAPAAAADPCASLTGEFAEWLWDGDVGYARIDTRKGSYWVKTRGESQQISWSSTVTLRGGVSRKPVVHDGKRLAPLCERGVLAEVEEPEAPEVMFRRGPWAWYEASASEAVQKDEPDACARRFGEGAIALDDRGPGEAVQCMVQADFSREVLDRVHAELDRNEARPPGQRSTEDSVWARFSQALRCPAGMKPMYLGNAEAACVATVAAAQLCPRGMSHAEDRCVALTCARGRPGAEILPGDLEDCVSCPWGKLDPIESRAYSRSEGVPAALCRARLQELPRRSE